MAQRIPFVTSPTPLDPAPRLAVAIGLDDGDLFVKRDDLIPLGAGGNKVRKLQYSCAEALEAGATTLLTTGAPQSNHARLTAAAGARLGLRVVLVLEGEKPPRLLGNLLLDDLLGAEVIWAGETDLPSRAEHARADLVNQGETVFLIPFGGTSATSALGYVDAAHELLEQSPDFRHLVVAVGSGGTMAGLVSALGPERVLGVDSGAIPNSHEVVTSLVGAISGSVRLDGRPLRLDTTQIGTGYAHLTDATRKAMSVMATSEGLFVDPVYTARALAGLIDAVRDDQIRPGERTIFLHTGGLPGLFGHPDLN
jgi:L-cysteate sulfo-lyase